MKTSLRHKSERFFMENYADPCKTYIHHPKRFKLSGRGHYTPDFYCVEDDKYIEVVLHSDQPEKYQKMKEAYPGINLEVIRLNPTTFKRSDIQPFTIKGFPLELYRRFKGRCAERGWTVKEGLIKLVTQFVENPKPDHKED